MAEFESSDDAQEIVLGSHAQAEIEAGHRTFADQSLAEGPIEHQPSEY